MTPTLKTEAPNINASEIVLQVTITQPVSRFKTEDAIDSSSISDQRSAIDQFVSTIETLNVLIARHSTTSEAINSQAQPDESDALESLFSLEEESEIAVDADAQDADIHVVEVDNDPANGVCDENQPTLRIDDNKTDTRRVEDDITRQLNNLVLLGYISAVESYFRCLTRQLVWADELTAEKVKDLKITYGAARHAEPELLPEAFLEDMTFITADSIKALLSGVIGIPSQGIDDVILEYDRICQLRHCIVHRFGRLGSKNASKLGLTTHKSLFEKPIKLSNSQLEEIAFSLLNFVRALNNDIYAKVLERSALIDVSWTWEEQKDLQNFERIYAVFRKTAAPHGSPSIIDAYRAFKAKCEKNSASHKRRAMEKRKTREAR